MTNYQEYSHTRIEYLLSMPIIVIIRRRLWVSRVGWGLWNIDNYTSIISTLHTGDDETDRSLIQYSLYRVNGFIQGITDNFLEQQAYVVSDEEFAKVEAVISVYRAISEELADQSLDLEALLKSM